MFKQIGTNPRHNAEAVDVMLLPLSKRIRMHSNTIALEMTDSRQVDAGTLTNRRDI